MTAFILKNTCAIIKSPAVKFTGLTITQVVDVAPGLTPTFLSVNAILV